MSWNDKNAGSGGLLAPVAWLPLALTVALILVLAGCGSGGSSGNSSQEDTGASAPSSGQTETSDTSGSAQEKSTEQASADGELGAPALGDPDAPVVMVEYADYQ